MMGDDLTPLPAGAVDSSETSNPHPALSQWPLKDRTCWPDTAHVLSFKPFLVLLKCLQAV